MNWNNAMIQIKAWQAAHPNQPKCFLIKASEIAQIISQGNNTALKVYLGQDSNGKVNTFFIGCVDDGNGGHNDFNIPEAPVTWDAAVTNDNLPVKKDGMPCPTACGTSNYLNS